jgi:hypothetical protein
MMAKFWAIIEAIKAFKWFAAKIEEYIIKPSIKAYNEYKFRKIDKHYELKQKRRDELEREINSAITSGTLDESDEKLRQLMRKLHNLGDVHDNNN